MDIPPPSVEARLRPSQKSYPRRSTQISVSRFEDADFFRSIPLRAQIDEASRLSLTDQAISFAVQDTRELEVATHDLGQVKACGLTRGAYDDITWTAIQVICNQAKTTLAPYPGAATPRSATAGDDQQIVRRNRPGNRRFPAK